MGQANLAHRPARRQLVALQRNDLGIDEQEMRLRHSPVSAMQTEQIAAFQDERSNLIIAAHPELQPILQSDLTAGPKHTQAHPPALYYLQPRAAHPEWSQAVRLRQQVFHQHPGHRQPAIILDFHDDRDCLADLPGDRFAVACGCQVADPIPSRDSAQKQHRQQNVSGQRQQPRFQNQGDDQDHNDGEEPTHIFGEW